MHNSSKTKELTETDKNRKLMALGSKALGSWLLNIYFNVVFTRFAAKWHILDFCIGTNGEEGFSAMRAVVPFRNQRVSLAVVNMLFVKPHTAPSPSPFALAGQPPR